MPIIWKCSNCGFEDTVDNLSKTVLKWVFHNNLWDTRAICAVKEETYEAERYDEEDFRTWESYRFICPSCGEEEDWYFTEEYTTPFSRFRFYHPRRRRR